MAHYKLKSADFWKHIRFSEDDIYICTEESADGPLGFATVEKPKKKDMIIPGTMVVLAYFDQEFMIKFGELFDGDISAFLKNIWPFEKSQACESSLMVKWVNTLSLFSKNYFALFSPSLQKGKNKGISLSETNCIAHERMRTLVGNHPAKWKKLKNRYMWHALYTVPCEHRVRVFFDSSLSSLAATSKELLSHSTGSALVVYRYKKSTEVLRVVDRIDNVGDGLETRFQLSVLILR